MLRTSRLRADTTVIPANVAYPTDTGLLTKAMKRIAVAGQRFHAAGRPVHGIAAKLRMRSAQGRDEAQATAQRITGELANLAEKAAKDGSAIPHVTL